MNFYAIFYRELEQLNKKLVKHNEDLKKDIAIVKETATKYEDYEPIFENSRKKSGILVDEFINKINKNNILVDYLNRQ